MDVFDRINKILSEKKIKKIDLARGADIPYSSLMSMLKRHPQNINYGIISRIAEYLEVDTDFLFYGDSDFSRNLDELYEKNLDSYSDNTEKSIINYEHNYKFEQRTLDSVKINLEYIYQNKSTTSLSLDFYSLDYFSSFWQVEPLLINLSIKDNLKHLDEISNYNNECKEAINKFQPPFTIEKMNKISDFRKKIKDNEKIINLLKNKISLLEKRLISIRENKYSIT